MRSFTREIALKILKGEINTETLTMHYPEFKVTVMNELSKIANKNNSYEIITTINSYKFYANLAIDKIKKSDFNQKNIDAFLPDVIKARIAIDVIQQFNLLVQTRFTGKMRFNLWDGFILQKILFKKHLARKPVSLFWFNVFWPLITNKKILLPLVHNKGIYCFYSKKLIKELCNLIGNSSCLEIGAGDGTLTIFLNELGVKCNATDNYSWENYIDYPGFVEKLEAKAALTKYKPNTVICSWPPPGNSFEKNIFNMDYVNLYIVIGTKNPLVSGNHEAYQNQKNFIIEYNEKLSGMLIPPSKNNAVYIFRRKN